MSDKPTPFEKRCESVSEITGVSVCFFKDEHSDETYDAFEDDEYLHIRHGKSGIRACFDVGGHQELSGKEQNQRTRAVLGLLKLAKFIGKHTLIDEEEDDDKTCPCCGQRV